ncbi:hypothetical protein TRSC58_06913 [Trypanosoma rangeli SC58]|uniref:Uncharacterized protein n=1 Tax=Trypanosoma rangeli SC58 TaxID=429131 RepID=A0A061ISL5_TRYRA|nr:hypothetical protein TRSC58_06913 [Trypanosoma rangeli SC58]
MGSVLNAIEEKEKELKELEARENALELHLQVYSEVIGLRKELEVVKKGAERMRRQLLDIDELVAKYDPAVESDLDSVEKEAQRSKLRQFWTSACQETPNEGFEDGSSWIKLDLDDLPQRVKAAREKLREAATAAAKLYKLQEGKINTNTDERDKAKAKLRESVEEEMSKLVETRSRLKQLNDDQRHHFHRGTHVKERLMSSQKEREALRGRVYNDESRQFADVSMLEDECKELTEWVESAKRELEDNKRSYVKEQSELQEQLQMAEDNGKEARELRECFERENEELKGLKHDLQQVLIYARVRHREEFA